MKPRVLRILNRLNIGGPTYNAVYLTHYLADAFDTQLVAGMRDASEGDSSPIAEGYGIRPQYVQHMRRELHPADDWRGLNELRRIIRAFRPHIVHTHAAKAGTLGRVAALLEGVPLRVHTFHGHVFHGYFSPLKSQLFVQIERALGQRSSAIVAISPSQLHELRDVYRIAPPDRFALVPNGFDLSRFAPDAERRAAFRQQYGLAEDEVAVGIVGRLVPVKNHALLLEALVRMQAQLTRPVRVFVIGDGELRETLQARAAVLGLRTRAEQGPSDLALEWTSWILDIERAYAGLDAVVLTSDNEGTPVSLIEALAAGLPVVSTAVGGVADVVKDNVSGRLVPAGDAAALALALLEVVNTPELRRAWGAAGRADVLSRYGVERLAAEMGALYRRLLAARGISG